MIMSVCECVCTFVPKHLSASELVKKLLGNPQAGFSVERCIEGVFSKVVLTGGT